MQLAGQEQGFELKPSQGLTDAVAAWLPPAVVGAGLDDQLQAQAQQQQPGAARGARSRRRHRPACPRLGEAALEAAPRPGPKGPRDASREGPRLQAPAFPLCRVFGEPVAVRAVEAVGGRRGEGPRWTARSRLSHGLQPSQGQHRRGRAPARPRRARHARPATAADHDGPTADGVGAVGGASRKPDPRPPERLEALGHSIGAGSRPNQIY